MRVLSNASLKGGVAKTITSVNIAANLNLLHGKRVLLVDNDRQGSSSQFFGLYDPDAPSLARALREDREKGWPMPMREIIRHTAYPGLDLVPANMTLMKAELEMMMDNSGRIKQLTLRKALAPLQDDYDFVVIDNAPSLDLCVVNALAASDDVIIPIKVDQFALEGLDMLLDGIEQVRELNPHIRVAGCVITQWQRTTTNTGGQCILSQIPGLPVFPVHIRKAEAVNQSTFVKKPLEIFAPRSTAAQDYRALTEAYLRMCY